MTEPTFVLVHRAWHGAWAWGHLALGGEVPPWVELVVRDRDQAIPPPAQEQMAQRSSSVHHLDSSHSPFVSMPQQVDDLLLATG